MFLIDFFCIYKIFLKVRLLECGSFEGFTWHCPVHAYKVDFMKSNSILLWSSAVITATTNDGNNDIENGNTEINSNVIEENPQPFQFQCRIPFDERTGELEECQFKISLRKVIFLFFSYFLIIIFF